MTTTLATPSRYRYKHLPTGRESAQDWSSETEVRLWLITYCPRTEGQYEVVPVLADPDAITDIALSMLSEPDAERPRHVECPGCDMPIHRTNRAEHARVCDELRQLAGGGR